MTIVKSIYHLFPKEVWMFLFIIGFIGGFAIIAGLIMYIVELIEEIKNGKK